MNTRTHAPTSTPELLFATEGMCRRSIRRSRRAERSLYRSRVA